MRLRENLKKICQEKHWTLARLARESGVPNQTLHNWTTGRRSVDPDQIRNVAQALGVSVHFLLFGERDPLETPTEEILREIFTGDLRVSIQRIEKKR